MKTAIVIIFLFLVGVAASIFTYQRPIATEISVLWDVTDKHIANPDAKEILRLYNFSGENKWNAALFSFSNVTDVSINRISELKLEKENKWLSNELEREKDINKVQTGISEIISENDRVGKHHSSVYLPIAKELKKLSASHSEKRILIIYSDLMENIPGLSFYDKKQFSLLQSNPDDLKKVFERLEHLPSLNGIEVFLIYQPANIDSDREFKAVSGFYKKLLEEKGARVIISANLSI